MYNVLAGGEVSWQMHNEVSHGAYRPALDRPTSGVATVVTVVGAQVGDRDKVLEEVDRR